MNVISQRLDCSVDETSSFLVNTLLRDSSNTLTLCLSKPSFVLAGVTVSLLSHSQNTTTGDFVSQFCLEQVQRMGLLAEIL